MVLDEVFGILLDVLGDVAEGLVEGCCGLVDGYQVVDVGDDGWSDRCFGRRAVGGVRHGCLDGLFIARL